MPIEECVGDVFDPSCLTWGRPEGVMRLPISIKLCDRSLYEEAEEVNEDEVEFGNHKNTFSEVGKISDLSLLSGVYANVDVFASLIDAVIERVKKKWRHISG